MNISVDILMFMLFLIVLWITLWIWGGSEWCWITYYTTSCCVYDCIMMVSPCFPNPLKYSIKVHQFSNLSKNWYVQDSIIELTYIAEFDNILVSYECLYICIIISYCYHTSFPINLIDFCKFGGVCQLNLNT